MLLVVTLGKTMIRYLLTAALLVASPALAGETGLRGSLDEPPAGASWHGFYAGAIAGLATSTGRADLGAHGGVLIPLDVSNGLFARSIDHPDEGLTGGITAGFNYQSGGFVGGVEADVSFADFRIRHTMSRIDPNPFPPFTGLVTNSAYHTDFGLLATARVRAGVALDRSLIYATGGFAAGKVTNRFSIALPGLAYASPDWSASGYRYGYAVGGGVETRLTETVSMKLEALYVDLEDTVVNGADPAAFPGESISYRFRNDMILGRLGLNVAF